MVNWFYIQNIKAKGVFMLLPLNCLDDFGHQSIFMLQSCIHLILKLFAYWQM